MARGPLGQQGGNALKCFNCGGSHLRKNCTQLQQAQAQNVAEGCYIYGRKGYFARECWYAEKLAEKANPINDGPGNPLRNNNNNNRNNNPEDSK